MELWAVIISFVDVRGSNGESTSTREVNERVVLVQLIWAAEAHVT